MRDASLIARKHSIFSNFITKNYLDINWTGQKLSAKTSFLTY